MKVKRVGHIIGNGDMVMLFDEKPRKGFKVACNVTPIQTIEEGIGYRDILGMDIILNT